VQKNLFAESSGLIHLVSNPGAGTFYWGFPSVPVLLKVSGCVAMNAAPQLKAELAPGF
jgi:hypothetical protein